MPDLQPASVRGARLLVAAMRNGRGDACAIVYALVDPLDSGHVRYVGMARRSKRPYDHAREARQVGASITHKVNWIRKLQAEGREPVVLVLEELSVGVSKKLLGFVEACYIRSLTSIGHKLTNGTAGGDGLVDPTPEIRAKIGNAGRGRKHSDETRAKMRAAANTPEAKQRNREKSLGVVMPQETREKISAGVKRAFIPSEIRARIGAARKGHVVTPETRAAISATMKATLARKREKNA